MINAIDMAFSMGFPANDAAAGEGFWVHSGRIMEGFVLAIDGFGVTIHCPFKHDVE